MKKRHLQIFPLNGGYSLQGFQLLASLNKENLYMRASEDKVPFFSQVFRNKVALNAHFANKWKVFAFLYTKY